MPGDGGEAIRAAFQAAKEEAAQAAEDAGQAIAKHINTTAENVLDSVQTVENADAAAADAARGIHGNADTSPGGEAGSSQARRSALNKMLNGEDAKLTPGTPAYDAYIEELAKDSSKNGKISGSSTQEAKVAVQAEADGDLPGPIARTPLKPDGDDDGDFTDATGQKWEVKSSPDIAPNYSKQAGRPLRQPQSDATFTDMIDEELGKGQKVLLDPHGMSPNRLSHLQQLVASNPAWEGKVIWGR